MIAFGPCQALITKRRQGRTPPCVLDTCPGKAGIEIVAAVHEDRAGFQLITEASRCCFVPGEDGGAQTIGTVVHQAHGLRIIRHRHDADNRTKRLLTHHQHGMIDAGEDLGREIGRGIFRSGEACRIEMRLGTACKSVGNMVPHDIGQPQLRHGTKRGGLVKRRAHHILRGERHRIVNEAPEQILVHIDALDAAATLAGVEHRAINQRFDRSREIGISPDIGGVLAAQLQPHRRESSCRRTLDRTTRRNRPREADMVDLCRADQRQGFSMAQHKRLEQSPGQSRPVHGHLETFAHQQGLRGMFEQNRIARHQCRDDGIDGGEIGVVPRRNGEDNADGITADVTHEPLARLRQHRGESHIGNENHVPCTLLEAFEFASGVTDGAAHLP